MKKLVILVLLMINVLLLIVGTFMETLASVILLTPILLPLAESIGIDPIHFGVIMVVNLNIGLATPPLGVCLIVAAPLAETSMSGSPGLPSPSCWSWSGSCCSSPISRNWSCSSRTWF